MQIHEESELIKHGYKELLKQEVRKNLGLDLFQVPGVTGLAISHGTLVVTTDGSVPDDYLNAVPSKVNDTDVIIHNFGAVESLQTPKLSSIYDMGFAANAQAAGGMRLTSSSGEFGTCFAVLVDTSNKDQKFAVTSAHVLHNSRSASIGGTTPFNSGTGNKVSLGSVSRDVRICNGTSYLDAAAAAVPNNVTASPDVVGIGRPTGFSKPSVGMQITTNGLHSGKTTQKIVMINYDLRNDTGGNCETQFKNGWAGSVRSKPGDSGSSMFSDDRKFIGILTTNTSKGSYNLSAWYMQQPLKSGGMSLTTW